MLANGGWDLIQRLTLILLTWTKWRAPTNASKWRMGFNSTYKGSMYYNIALRNCEIYSGSNLRESTAVVNVTFHLASSWLTVNKYPNRINTCVSPAAHISVA